MSDPTKPPIVRRGQYRPYTRATRKEIERRLKAAAVLQGWGFEKSDIHWFFQEVFGIESRQTERYIAHARAQHPQRADFRG